MQNDWLCEGLLFFCVKRKEAKENRLIPWLGTELVLGGDGRFFGALGFGLAIIAVFYEERLLLFL